MFCGFSIVAAVEIFYYGFGICFKKILFGSGNGWQTRLDIKSLLIVVCLDYFKAASLHGLKYIAKVCAIILFSQLCTMFLLVRKNGNLLSCVFWCLVTLSVFLAMLSISLPSVEVGTGIDLAISVGDSLDIVVIFIEFVALKGVRVFKSFSTCFCYRKSS